MDDKIIFFAQEPSLLVTTKDTRLMVITTRIAPKKWSLRVENVLGIRSEWCENYVSAEAAVQAAVKAIEEEGVDEFLDDEGFEYLQELCTTPGERRDH